jgi:AcrR family transcriptional regulator
VERNDQVVESAPAIVAEEVARGTGDFRMADVATRLGVSERTLARYFGGRDGLVREAAAVRDASFALRLARAEGGSTGIATTAANAARSDTAHLPLMRLAELAAEGRASHVDGARRAAFGDISAAATRDLGQQEGIAPDQLVLALIAVATFPIAFPRWTNVITGADPDSDDFRARHRSAVDTISERLTGRRSRGEATSDRAVAAAAPSPVARPADGASLDLTGRIDLTTDRPTDAGPGRPTTTAPIHLTAESQALVQRAAAYAREHGATEVTPHHMFQALRSVAPSIVEKAHSSSNGD